MLYKSLLVVGLLALSQAASASFIVTQTNDASVLAQTILGSGISLSGTPTLTGNAAQSGTFQNFTTGVFNNPITGTSGQVNMASGIILSSGPVVDAMGNYTGGASSNLGGLGDAALTAIAGYPTFDAVSLSFDFVPDADTLFIQFLFLSTEYPNYVNTQYNDVFGFFVNGTNVALVPGTTDPVTINSINLGRPTGTNPSNAQYFTQYSNSSTPFNYGGATILLTANATVNPGVVNNFRFAVADGSDRILDSAILIGAGQFTTVNPGGDVPEPGTWALIGTGLVSLVLFRRRKQA